MAIFVEGDFAELMVATALRQVDNIELDAVKIRGMGGAVPARTVNHQHNNDPTRTFDSICILDGDQVADYSDNVFILPGTTYPENYVFDFILANIDPLSARRPVRRASTGPGSPPQRRCSAEFRPDYAGAVAKVARGAEFAGDVLGQDWPSSRPTPGT